MNGVGNTHLLPDAAVDVGGDRGPLLRTELLHERPQDRVFLFAPRTLSLERLFHFLLSRSDREERSPTFLRRVEE